MIISNKGFSLIEIMIAVTIAAIVGSVIAPNVMNSLHSSKKKQAEMELQAISSGLNQYKLDNYNYPTESQGINALVKKPTINPIPHDYPTKGYLNKINSDPWGNEYVYKLSSDGSEFEIYSFGPDGKDKTDDDILIN